SNVLISSILNYGLLDDRRIKQDSKNRNDEVYSDFFFQAEAGIRDRNVTGVQTCALPILFGGLLLPMDWGVNTRVSIRIFLVCQTDRKSVVEGKSVYVDGRRSS